MKLIVQNGQGAKGHKQGFGSHPRFILDRFSVFPKYDLFKRL